MPTLLSGCSYLNAVYQEQFEDRKKKLGSSSHADRSVLICFNSEDMGLRMWDCAQSPPFAATKCANQKGKVASNGSEG